MTFAISLLGGIAIWGSCLQWEAYNDSAERYKQGRPDPTISELFTQSAMPRNLESLWRTSPSLVMSGLYTFISLTFAYYLIDLSGPQPLSGRSLASKFWWIRAHTTPQQRFIGCGIWLIPLIAAVFVFVRSVAGFLSAKKQYSE